MKRTLLQVVALVLVLFPGAHRSRGQIPYVRTTNVAAVADATLSSGAPDVTIGNQIFVIAGVDGGANRGLFRFDVSCIPTNATVTNVTLNLIGISRPESFDTFGLSLLLTNWDEYAACWNNRFTSMPWTIPGGQAGTDFAPFPSAIAILLGNVSPTNQFTDDGSNPHYGLVHDVQTWVNNPAQNFGWMLAALDESSSGSMFAIGSREFAGYEPILTVGYIQPFTPPIIWGASIANGLFQFNFNVEPYRGYGVQRCNDLTGTNWVNVRVFDPAPFPAVATDFELLTGSNSFFRVVTPR